MFTTQTGPQPADLADVRATNLAVVLRFVRAHAPCSRADIAASTGLNKATVSSLVAELLDRRLVRETGLAENRIGRPATMLVVDGAPYAAIGLEVSIDELTVVAVDLAGAELLSWRRAFDGSSASPGRAVSAIAALAGRAVNRVGNHGREVLGLTVAVPGLVDPSGTVRLATTLGWRDLPLGADLRRALRDPGYEVVVDNDANLAALAEYRHGPYAGTANLVHLTGGAGLGAGVVADGRLLRGGRGFAGELGHVPVVADGPLCPCGRRGCLEVVAGIPALIRRALPDAAEDGPVTDFAPEVDRIRTKARRGDRATLDALAETGRHLGRAVALLANLVNPEVVLLGGYFATLAPWLLPAAEAELHAHTLAAEAGGARLLASALGTGAAAAGGAARTLETVDAGRLPLRDPARGTARDPGPAARVSRKTPTRSSSTPGDPEPEASAETATSGPQVSAPPDPRPSDASRQPAGQR
ncbi:ROK family transcriptional regulator [Plantactinospora sp. KLBMP9567]|uniref:ROK family transcriptional regulator n=1 Tax=Plantactinospora sp. KLBMP9567 TaxID=3085900 RepID=UPI002981C052|nr:ROK family transcriptional regulator [Plantactinospora sp. KLBMP9567]MDW5323180.1 ROK family transcriptional regulator [Plantactinospora sp. KLBMP9567]